MVKHPSIPPSDQDFTTKITARLT